MSFSALPWRALSALGCSRDYGRERCDMEEGVTLAVPNVGLGLWKLGLSLHQATRALRQILRKSPDGRVQITCFGGSEVVLSLPHGIRLAFDGETQLLERISACYPWPPTGLFVELPVGSSTSAQRRIVRVCAHGETLSTADVTSFSLRGSRASSSAPLGRELRFAGITFTAPSTDSDLCEEVSVISDDATIAPLCPPCGVIAHRVTDVCESANSLCSGIQIELEVGVPPSFTRSGQVDSLAADHPSGSEAQTQTDCRIVTFFDCEQDVLDTLGQPEDVHVCEKNGVQQDEKHGVCSTPDYFFNYNSLGLDVMFCGQTGCVIRFVLHANTPCSVHFGQYERCPFSLRLPCCCSLSRAEKHRPHGSGTHLKHPVTTTTLWREIESHVLCGCARLGE